MFTVLSLLGGLMFLAMGSAALMRGTVGLASFARVSPFLIGLIAVAFGSSAPQLFTAMQAANTGTPATALAATIGASIFNIFVTLGAVTLRGGAVKLNFRLWLRGNLALAVIAIALATALYVFAQAGGNVPRWLGLTCLTGLVVYVIIANAYDHKHPTPIPALKQTRKLHPILMSALFVAGLLALLLGANLLVDAATQLSLTRGLNPIFLGITVLAIGTATPQLVASFLADSERNHELMLNNLVGNTIFNILGIAGILFSLQTITIQPGGLLLTSFMVLAGATLAFLIFTHPSMRRFKRAEAILFLLAYGVYLGYVIHSF